MARDFEVAPAGAFARGFPLVLGGVFVLAPIATVIVAIDQPMVLAGALPAMLVAIAFVAMFAWSIRHPRVRFEEGVLTAGRLPRLRMRAKELQLDQARVVDLEAEPALRPTFRLLGTSLPGYRQGWFWLGDRSRAFLLVTDTRRVLVLPRNDGGPVLLSVLAPDALLQALRRAA